MDIAGCSHRDVRLLGWTTVVRYQTAPPFPDRFVTTGGAVLMSAEDIYAGKAGFQKADLMDYGSLYGMGSYFGEDYTAQNLVRLAILTEDNIAKAKHKKNLADLAPEQQAGVKVTMQAELQGVDLTKQVAVIPDALAGAITILQGRNTDELLLPLMLLVLEAIQNHRLIKTTAEFKYGLAYLYIIGAAFWNFVGAGVFGGHPQRAARQLLRARHVPHPQPRSHCAVRRFRPAGDRSHLFCLRYVAADRYPFGGKMGRAAFWLYNGGLVLWILLHFFPIGWPQLNAVYEHGLAYARSQEFYDTTNF
jgi:nitric oxide reductase large subunit